MIDPRKLLDQLLGAGGEKGAAGGGLDLGKVLQQGLEALSGSSPAENRPAAGAPAPAAPAAPGGAAAGDDLSATIGNAIGGKFGTELGGKLGAQFGGLAGGALAGGLVSILLGNKSIRKMSGKVLTYGGLAAVGAIAYTAYRNWQAGKSGEAAPAAAPPQLPPPGSPFHPDVTPGGPAALAETLVHAMIVAAKADGTIDEHERGRILAQLERLGVGSDMRAFLDAELARPLDIDGVVKRATTPELAAEIYAASLLALGSPPDAVGTAYLTLLAARLRLDPGLRSALEAAVASA